MRWEDLLFEHHVERANLPPAPDGYYWEGQVVGDSIPSLHTDPEVRVRIRYTLRPFPGTPERPLVGDD